MKKKRYTITSALLYANGPIHIGHLAGAYLPADIYVRYLKNIGHDVAFICGSDEHGAAITLQAKKEGCSPKDIIDKYHNLNKKSFEQFGINFSIYHRTSEKIHHETAIDFFKKLNLKQVFTQKKSSQFYDAKNKQFLADRYIFGQCPKCGYQHAYGDQCESCGSTLSPEELIDPKSKLSGDMPIKKDTKHWYLPMQKHESWLKKWIDNGEVNNKILHSPKEWKDQVIGQCKSWLNSGLRERAMTRDLDWGVKVPVENSEGKVLYVWLDAPIGYISATKKWAKENNRDWKDFWQDSNTDLIHFIGKDNIVFHTIIFPIILHEMEHYILPKNVPANEFLNLEGKKLSTSRNWAIWLHEFLEDFSDQQDALRYVLCSIAPENKDADFTWFDFQARINNELVAIYGNFVNRVLVLTNKYWDGIVPQKNTLTDLDNSVLKKVAEFPDKIGSYIQEFKFKKALSEMMNLARLGNKYLAETEPWKLVKTEPKKTETIMNIGIQITATLSIVSGPFLPFTSAKLQDALKIKNINWKDSGKEILRKNNKINLIKPLFKKIEDNEIKKQLKKLNL
tara:strand:- start:3600 stop:5294 length:1695 start_codon:yes stop_codon:yes gene_type:complete